MSLDTLSDAELRMKLVEYDIVAPVTQTTRKILIKRLKKVIESGGTKKRIETPSGSSGSRQSLPAR